MSERTVLVVDDEAASGRAVQRTLVDECRVITATSAAAALDLMAAQPVALVITDQRMPDMLGTELLGRTASAYPHVIRLLLTGYTDIDTLVDAINAGHVYYYLTKPWEPSELRLAVRRGLERYEIEADRQRLLAELERSCERLRREAAQKGRLLTLAAHELGTPLHVLANALALLADAGLPPAAGTWLETARRNAEWLARGVAQLTAAGRWTRTPLRLHRRPVDPHTVIDAVVGQCSAAMRKRTLAVERTLEEQLPCLWADPVWLQRALWNLLSNAIRFTPDGGCITIAAHAVAGGVNVTVRDTGIGMDATVLDEVFEPFSAACGDVSLHTSGQLAFGARGLGLGLAVTKAIIEEHGGRIGVASERGVGSCFALTLPCG